MKNMRDDIFIKADERYAEALKLLKKGFELFPKTYVPKSLLKVGYTTYRGIIRPLNEVSHRILLDFYQKTFLHSFILLFESLWNERASRTSEFAFRTLFEMGVEDSFLVFSSDVSQSDRRLYTIILLLADYASIETSMSSFFYKWFENLYKEYEDFLVKKLTDKEYRIILKLKKSLNHTNEKDEFRKAVKGTRQLFGNVKNKLLQKYTKKGSFGVNENYKGMKSGESHTLHGNVFLISNRLSITSQQNHLFRVYAYLFIACNPLLQQLSQYLKNSEYKKEVDQFLHDHSIFSQELSQAWQTQENTRK